ncbi:hypothetical protein CCACVL1_23525 [Corchorus capsularis]|uniref:Uncharacterized protein n=1 Tax=Corchorus capsularis TaxID=210143 RepID=A0A1R3GTM0_COCAP|nr:hypothetical protein CCACVL1_23525 [Corchorus capsularis]
MAVSEIAGFEPSSYMISYKLLTKRRSS